MRMDEYCRDIWQATSIELRLCCTRNSIAKQHHKSCLPHCFLETKTIHFAFGELTMTLEDIVALTGLPVSGKPVFPCPVLANDPSLKNHALMA